MVVQIGSRWRLGILTTKFGRISKSTTTFLKSFPKSIKNSSHNRFYKLDTSHFGVSVKKIVFFQNLDFLYRKSYSKSEGFWRLSQDLVVFFNRFTERWSVQLLESIVRRIFYRFWKTFFKAIVFSVGRSFLLSFSVRNAMRGPTSIFCIFPLFSNESGNQSVDALSCA